MSFGSLFFSFRGRINRSMFWVGVLAIIGAGFAGFHSLQFIFTFVSNQYQMTSPLPAPIARFLPSIAIAVATVAVWTLMVKRLHDRSKSVWGLLLFAALAGASASWIGYYDISWLPRPALPDMALRGIGIMGGIGMIWLIVEVLLIPSSPGANRFGPDPIHETIH